MKTKFLFYFIILLTAFVACKKAPQVNMSRVEIYDEVVDAQASQVSIEGSYSYPSEIKSITLFLGEKEDLSDALVYATTVETVNYSVVVEGLKQSTTYYYCYEFDNGINSLKSSIKSFETEYSGMNVTTTDVTGVTGITAKCGGVVTANNGVNVKARGVCWSTNRNPTVTCSHTTDGSGAGSFTSSIVGLTSGTTYYVRAYATNSLGAVYGEEKSFTTEGGGYVHNETIVVNNVTFEMVAVEGGTFWMGAQNTNPNGINYDANALSEESPVHQVTLSSFCIGKTEVTQELWRTVMGSNPSNFSGTNLPVEKVNWYEVQTFISKLNDLTGRQFRLPTEAEWEYAARGGKQNHGYIYSGSNTIGDIGWYSDNSNSKTHPVGTKSPNELGLYDMCGNVLEWCQDWYDNYGSDSQTNPTGPNSGSERVYRGGGGGSVTKACRVSSHYGIPPDHRFKYCGLRLVSSDNGVQVQAPTVTTTGVSNVTEESASSGGNVINDGGSSVTSRGVCWSTSHNPTVDGSHTTDGSGTGSFSSSITGLTEGTTYYVRAYATNSEGTSYGEEKSFTTSFNIVKPTVTTNAVANVTVNSATCGGNVTSDGGSSVTSRGVCWSTSHNPTVADSHTTDGSGTGSFSSSITGLTEGTTYYVRAYATNSVGTSYGEEKSFTTETGGEFGTFSVSSTKKVTFSQGNLQYQASTDTWRFAENQYDCIGEANSNISSSYSGWIDLFGWGTSGYNNKYPYMTSTNYSDYGNGNNNISGTNYDWGVYNAISNGGNQAGMWRTLTRVEWAYLFNTRSGASSKYSQATVNGVTGLVILPDTWTLPSGCGFTPYVYNVTNYSSNTYSLSQWSAMESAGAVFLPAAGYRNGTSVYDVGTDGYYWSSSYYNERSAYYMSFGSGYVGPSYDSIRYYGRSVRLVADY